jgi:hypothetical protein
LLPELPPVPQLDVLLPPSPPPLGVVEPVEPGIFGAAGDPSEDARSLTCSTTRLMTLRASGRRAAATPAATAAVAPAATAARRTIFFVLLRAAVFFPPFRPAAARLADFELFFDAFREAFDDLFLDDFFAELLREPFFDDFFEERFFAAMGHSPFQSVGVGEAVT